MEGLESICPLLEADEKYRACKNKITELQTELRAHAIRVVATWGDLEIWAARLIVDTASKVNDLH